MKKEIKVITHYYKSDPEFISDYTGIEIIINDKPIAYFGDDYHDKGRDKCKGFLEGMKYIVGDYNITYTNIADYED